MKKQKKKNRIRSKLTLFTTKPHSFIEQEKMRSAITGMPAPADYSKADSLHWDARGNPPDKLSDSTLGLYPKDLVQMSKE